MPVPECLRHRLILAGHLDLEHVSFAPSLGATLLQIDRSTDIPSDSTRASQLFGDLQDNPS